MYLTRFLYLEATDLIAILFVALRYVFLFVKSSRTFLREDRGLSVRASNTRAYKHLPKGFTTPPKGLFPVWRYAISASGLEHYKML